MSKNDSLTPRQLKAIEAMLTADSIGQASQTAGVGQSTLYRWLHGDPLFQAELRRAQDQAIDAAVSRLSGETHSAASTLASIHRDKKAPASVRVQAAQAVLTAVLKLKEQRDLAERIAALEERMIQR